MARISQKELNQELRERGFAPTDLRSRGGHRLWTAPNGRHCWVPDWDGVYTDDVFDEIIRSVYRVPGLPKRPR